MIIGRMEKVVFCNVGEIISKSKKKASFDGRDVQVLQQVEEILVIATRKDSHGHIDT